MTNFYRSFSADKPDAWDTTSSKALVYQRKNIIQVSFTNDDGSVNEQWQYDERKMSKAEFEIIQLKIALTELYELML